MVGEEHGVGGGMVTEGSVVGGRAVRGGVDVVFHYFFMILTEKTQTRKRCYCRTHTHENKMFASSFAFKLISQSE